MSDNESIFDSEAESAYATVEEDLSSSYSIFDSMDADTDGILGDSSDGYSNDGNQFTKGAKKAYRNTRGSLDTFAAGISELSGNYVARDRKQTDAYEWQQKASEIELAVENYADIETAEDLGDYIAQASGQGLTIIAEALATGAGVGTGAKIAYRVGAGLTKNTAKALAKQGTSQGVLREAKRRAIAGGMTEEAAEGLVTSPLFIRQIAKDQVKATAKKVGSRSNTAATAAFFGAFETGSITQEVQEATGMSVGEAFKASLPYALPAAALNLPFAQLTKSALVGKGFRPESVGKVQSRAKEFFKDIGIGAGIEMPTEMTQELLSIFAAQDAAGEDFNLTEEHKNRIINAGIMAAVGSASVTGPISGTQNLNRARKDRKASKEQSAIESDVAEFTENIGIDPSQMNSNRDDTVTVDTEGNAQAPDPEPGIDESGDATFGQETGTASTQTNDLVNKAGMNDIFDSMDQTPADNSNDATFDQSSDATVTAEDFEPTQKALPNPDSNKATTSEMNVELPEKDGVTLVKDESGKTISLTGKVAAAYKKIRASTPTFARNLLSTTTAISNAVAIVENKGAPSVETQEEARNILSNPDGFNEMSRRWAEKVQADTLRGGVRDQYEQAIRNQADRVIELIDKKRASGQEPSMQEAALYKEATQWVASNPKNMTSVGKEMADTIPQTTGNRSVDYEDNVQVLPENKEIRQTKIIGRNPVGSGNFRSNEIPVTDWDRPFTSSTGDRGLKQAKAQLQKMINPASPGYNEPASARFRNEYPPSNTDFEVRKVDKDGELLPRNTAANSNKVKGHVVTATPRTQTEGLNIKGLTAQTLANIQKALNLGDYYLSPAGRKKHPGKAKLSMTFKVLVETGIYQNKNGDLFVSENRAKQKILILEREAKKAGKKFNPADYSINQVVDANGKEGWKITTLQTKEKSVFMPSLMWAGLSVIKSSYDPSFEIGGDGRGAAAALSAGLQALEEYQTLQGTRLDSTTQMAVKEKQNEAEPLVEINGQQFSLADLKEQHNAHAREVTPTVVEWSDARIEEYKKQQQDANEVETPREFEFEYDDSEATYVETIFKEHVLPPLLNMLTWANDSPKQAKGKKDSVWSRSKSFTNATLTQAVKAALDPLVSVVYDQPSPALLADPANPNEADQKIIKDHAKWQAKVRAHLSKRIPVMVRQQFVEEVNQATTKDDQTTFYTLQEIAETSDADIVQLYVIQGGKKPIADFITEAMDEMYNEVKKDIIDLKPTFKNKKLQFPGGIVATLDFHQKRGEKLDEIPKRYPKQLNASIAKIEGMAAGIRGYLEEVLEKPQIMQDLGSNLQTTDQANPGTQNLNTAGQVNKVGEPEVSLLNEESFETDAVSESLINDAGQMNSGRSQIDRDQTGEQTADTKILQDAMDKVASVNERREQGEIDVVPYDPNGPAEQIWKERTGTTQYDSEEHGNWHTYNGSHPWKFNPKYVVGKTADEKVIYYGDDNFTRSKVTGLLHRLSSWAQSTFDTNQIVFVSKAGLEALINDNKDSLHPDFLSNLEALNKPLKTSVPFKVAHGGGFPTVIIVNERYRYTDNKGRTYRYDEVKADETLSDVMTAFAHELGHEIYSKWQQEMPKALRAKLTQEYEAAVSPQDRTNYTLDEWMADQFSLYVQQAANPENKKANEARTANTPPHWKALFAQLQKLYKKVGQIFQYVTGRTGGASKSYHDFLQDIANENGIRERAHQWYRKQVQSGVNPTDAFNATQEHMEKAFAKAKIKNPKTIFKDAPRQPRVKPEESANEQVEIIAKSAQKDSTQSSEPGKIIEETQKSSFYGERAANDSRARADAWVNNLFNGDKAANRVLNHWNNQAYKALASVQQRMSQIPGGMQIISLIRQRPGDKATGKGTARVAERHYYNKWYQTMKPLHRRKGESKIDYQTRQTQLRDEIASGNVTTEDAKTIQRGLRDFARWMATKQQAARDASLNNDKKNGKVTQTPVDDKTILRFLESWNMPHNYVLDQLITQQGKQRFFELLDKYEKQEFLQDNKKASEEDWVAFREYVFKKITNSEGLIGSDQADNLQFNNSRARVLRNIPTWELLGRNGEPPLIDNQFDQAIRNYLHDGARQVAWEERFGGYEQRKDSGEWQWNANRMINDWIEDLKTFDRQNGTDWAAEGRDLVNILQGRSNRQLSTKGRMYSNVATALMNMLVLPFAVFASIPDVAGVAMRSDGQWTSLVKNIASSAKAAWGNDPEGLREMSESLGITSEHILQHAFIETGSSAFDNYSGGKYQKLMETQEGFFKLIQLEAWTNFTRILAMQTGRDYMNRMYADSISPLNVNGKKEVAERAFAELGVTPAEWAAINQKRNSNSSDFNEYLQDKEAQVMNKFVDEAIMRPSAEAKPGWHSDPRWQTVAHLKSYFWYMSETYWPRVFKQYSNAFGPNSSAEQKRALSRILVSGMMMLPLAVLGLALRDSMYYAFSDYEPPERDFLDLLGRTGALGPWTIPMEFMDTTSERGLTGDTVMRNVGPLYGYTYGALTQAGSTTLSKSVPGISWFRAGREAIKGSDGFFNDATQGRT